MVFLFVYCPLPDRVFHKILFILPADDCELATSQRIKIIIIFFSEIQDRL